MPSRGELAESEIRSEQDIDLLIGRLFDLTRCGEVSRGSSGGRQPEALALVNPEVPSGSGGHSGPGTSSRQSDHTSEAITPINSARQLQSLLFSPFRASPRNDTRAPALDLASPHTKTSLLQKLFAVKETSQMYEEEEEFVEQTTAFFPDEEGKETR